MNVLHVNTRAMLGGAARAGYRLHTALQRAGHQSRIVSTDYIAGRDDLQTWVPKTPFWWLLYHATWWLEIRTGLEGILNLTSRAGCRRHGAWADVINLHNLHGYYFSLPLLPRLEKAAPLVWTLHDMWALTGHCAYPTGCDRWMTGCGRCPNLPGPPKVNRDASRLLYKVRRRVYAKINPVLVTPSRWLLGQVQRAPLTRDLEAVCIPNGLDTETFRPVAKASARRALGLSSSDRVVLFSAHFLGGRRKGGDILLDALRLLAAGGLSDLRLLLVGGGGEQLQNDVPYPVLNLGRVESETVMAAVYSAADIFVLPTRADNLPNGLVESIACGTPCVSFRVGGVPEVVRPGQTGWLAEPEDADDLARCIRSGLADDEARRRMSRTCRRVAEREYDVHLMMQRYVDLYEELVRERHKRCGHSAAT